MPSDYDKYTWVDDDGSGSTGTPVSAERMNQIEEGIADHDHSRLTNPNGDVKLIGGSTDASGKPIRNLAAGSASGHAATYGQLSATQAEVDAVEGDVATLQSSLTSHTHDRLVSQNGDVKLIGGSIDASGKPIRNLAAGSASAHAATYGQLSATQAEVDAVEGDVATLQGDVSTLQSSLTSHTHDRLVSANGDVKLIGGSVDASGKPIRNLAAGSASGHAATYGQLSATQAEVDAVEGDVATLQSDLANHTHDYLISQSGDVRLVGGAVDASGKVIRNLAAGSASAHAATYGQLSATQAEVDAVEVDVAALQSDLASHTHDYLISENGDVRLIGGSIDASGKPIRNLAAGSASGHAATFGQTVGVIDNKGELLGGTGPDAIAAVASGVDGRVLTASGNAAPTGMEWQRVLPAGSILQFSGLKVPYGWLKCDGSAVSRTTYADLWSAIHVEVTGTRTSGSGVITGISSTADLHAGLPVKGTGIAASSYILTVDSATQITLTQNASSSGTDTLSFAPYGDGDGSTTFSLPKFHGTAYNDARVPIGYGAISLGNSHPWALGGSGGTYQHTLTEDEMPSHSHQTGPETSASNRAGSATGSRPTLPQDTGGAGEKTTEAGSDDPHTNMPPYLAVNFIIKT